VVFWTRRKYLLIQLLIILVVGGALWISFSGQYSRWLILFWPFWAILGGGAISGFAEQTISSFTLRRLTLILLSSLLIVSFVVDVVSEIGPMFGYSFKLINGSQTDEEYLRSYVREYNVIEYLNEHYDDYKAVSLALYRPAFIRNIGLFRSLWRPALLLQIFSVILEKKEIRDGYIII